MSADAGRLRLNDAVRVTSVGLRARPLRAALSALGIAIGTAAIVAVLGLSSSSQAGLLAEIDRLGTNMLTLEAGQSLTGEEADRPRIATIAAVPIAIPSADSAARSGRARSPTLATRSPSRGDSRPAVALMARLRRRRPPGRPASGSGGTAGRRGRRRA